MLKVQLFLQNYNNSQEGLDALQKTHGIHHKLHPKDGRVILDYDQFGSVKTNPIVRECRGLVLDRNNNWEVVARGFDRFFNYGECASERNKFNWKTAYRSVKHDGTMLLCYRWNGEVVVNTRFSFAEDVLDNGYSFRQLFDKAMPHKEGIEDYFRGNPRASLVFELTSPFNKIVRTYTNTICFLLGVRPSSEQELTPSDVIGVAAHIGVGATEFTPISCEFDIIEAIKLLPEDHEGFVAVDNYGNRWKFKSDTYVALHALKDNGNIANPKYAIPIILQNKADDVIAKFPEVEAVYKDISDYLYKQIELCQDIYNGIMNIENQKEFALKVKEVCPNGLIASIMFSMRKTGKQPLELLCEDDYRIAMKLWDIK